MCYLEAWATHVCPGRDRLRRFWGAVAEDPLMVDHPMTTVANWEERAIPVSFHGDGVPVTGVAKSWGRTMIMYTVSSMVGRGTTLQTMLLVWAVFKDALAVGGIKDSFHCNHTPYQHAHLKHCRNTYDIRIPRPYW